MIKNIIKKIIKKITKKILFFLLFLFSLRQSFFIETLNTHVVTESSSVGLCAVRCLRIFADFCEFKRMAYWLMSAMKSAKKKPRTRLESSTFLEDEDSARVSRLLPTRSRRKRRGKSPEDRGSVQNLQGSFSAVSKPNFASKGTWKSAENMNEGA